MSGITPADFLRYFTALGRADPHGALAVARELRERGVPSQVLLLDLVTAAQEEVGRRWQGNDWDIAREHAATAVSEAVLAALAGTGEGLTRGRVLVACVENEWHAMAGRIVAEVLRLHGWDATFLGASVPPAALAQHLHDTGPHAVALSCSVPSALPRARRMIEAAREAGVPVLVGGRGFGVDDRRAARLGASGWAGDVLDAAAALDTCPPYATPPPPLASPALDEYAELRLVERAAGDTAAARLERRHPAALASGWLGRQDVEYALDFLAAALFADDDRVFSDYVTWLAGVLAARGVPREALVAELEELLAALPPLPRAQRLLTAGVVLAAGATPQDDSAARS